MNEMTQPAVAGPVETTVRHCWPTPWLEAAMRAGFAHRKPGGEWEFLSDKMREMLAEFGAALQRDERERCAQMCELARPFGGRAWSTEQAAVFDALTHVAQHIRDA
jgi:hypothetical protein